MSEQNGPKLGIHDLQGGSKKIAKAAAAYIREINAKNKKGGTNV